MNSFDSHLSHCATVDFWSTVQCTRTTNITGLYAAMVWYLHFYFHHSPIAFYTSLLQASLNYIWTCSKENEYSCNSQCRVFTLGTQNQRKNGLNKTNQQHKTFKYLLQRLYYIFFQNKKHTNL